MASPPAKTQKLSDFYRPIGAAEEAAQVERDVALAQQAQRRPPGRPRKVVLAAPDSPKKPATPVQLNKSKVKVLRARRTQSHGCLPAGPRQAGC